MSALQSVKNYLVKLGPRNPVVQAALNLHGRRHGFRVTFPSTGICIRRKECQLILNDEQYVQAPIMMECFDLFFETIRAEEKEGAKILDFSKPGLHCYAKRNVSFYFPSVPEDDVMDAYTKEYLPKEGDIVWDAGAHAGATTYLLSELVGPTGRVYAFEPDESNFAYLVKNLEMHNVSNVVTVKKALSRTSGHATFNMDGTMSAGIREFLIYSEKDKLTRVETLSFEDACNEFGCVPKYVKMDIEGAEVAVVEGSREFLKRHDIHFAIESYHRLGETYTYTLLDSLFPDLGYAVKSENYGGQMFTWAKRKGSATE